MNTIDAIAKELRVVRKNQELTMKMVRLILEELELRKEIALVEKEMEADLASDDGSLAPVSMDSEGR